MKPSTPNIGRITRLARAFVRSSGSPVYWLLIRKEKRTKNGISVNVTQSQILHGNVVPVVHVAGG